MNRYDFFSPKPDDRMVLLPNILAIENIRDHAINIDFTVEQYEFSHTQRIVRVEAHGKVLGTLLLRDHLPPWRKRAMGLGKNAAYLEIVPTEDVFLPALREAVTLLDQVAHDLNVEVKKKIAKWADEKTADEEAHRSKLIEFLKTHKLPHGAQ